MRKIELKQVCGNCQWLVANITEEPYCLYDGHIIKSNDEGCDKYIFSVILKKSLEHIDVLEAEAERQIDIMRRGMGKKERYEVG